MTPAEAADRELTLVVAKLRAWAQDPPPVMAGLAPSAAFAYAAKVLESHDHRRDGAPPDVQAIERRVDLLTWLSTSTARVTPRAIADELAEIESCIDDDLDALVRAGLVSRYCTVTGTTYAMAQHVDLHEAGIRALVSQVEP